MSSEAIKIIVCDLQGYMTTGSGYVGMEKECLPNLKELKTCFLHGGLIRHNRSTLDFAKVLSRFETYRFEVALISLMSK